MTYTQKHAIDEAKMGYDVLVVERGQVDARHAFLEACRALHPASGVVVHVHRTAGLERIELAGGGSLRFVSYHAGGCGIRADVVYLPASSERLAGIKLRDRLAGRSAGDTLLAAFAPCTFGSKLPEDQRVRIYGAA